MPTCLSQLKRATLPEHQALEAELNLLRDGFTLADYVELLQKFHAFLRRWEPRILDHMRIEAPGFAGPRMKLEAIEQDLKDLNANKLPREADPEMPRLDTAAQAFGSMYVMEGSTLGGQILRRHFEERLGLTAERGCHYFSGYGQYTGAMWRGFSDLLESRPEQERSEMSAAAVETFQILRRWLTGGTGNGVPGTQTGREVHAGN